MERFLCIVFALTLFALVFVGTEAQADDFLQVWNDEAGYSFVDHGHDADPPSVASSAADVANGELRVRTLLNTSGDPWALAWVCAEFDYSHHDYYNIVTLKYTLDGNIQYTSGDMYAEIYVGLVNYTTGEIVDGVRDYIIENESGTPGEDRTVMLGGILKQDDTYRVYLQIWTNSEGPGNSLVDFQDYDYAVNLNSIAVYHTHATAFTSGGTSTDKEQLETYIWSQDRFEAGADSLAFAFRNHWHEISGWEIGITDFASASSSRESDSAALVTAYDQIIPKDYAIRVDAKNWLGPGRGCYNHSQAEDIRWLEYVQDSDRQAGKIMANFAWNFWYPAEEAEGWAHPFWIKNEDEFDVLHIKNLTFSISDEADADLPGHEFPDSSWATEWIIPPQDSLFATVLTEDEHYGGYIYFKYDIYDFLGDHRIGRAWGRHQVYEESGPQHVDLEIMEPSLDMQPSLAAAGAQVSFRMSLTECGEGPVRLTIHDAAGRTIRRFARSNPLGRQYIVRWDTRDNTGTLVPSGRYYCRLSGTHTVVTRPVTVVR